MKKIVAGSLFLIFCLGEFACNNSSKSTNVSWDFTKKKVYCYTYSKVQDTKNRTGSDSTWNQKYMTREGQFYIQSRENHLGRLLYPNAITSVKLPNEKTNSFDTLSFLNLGFERSNLSSHQTILDADSVVLFPEFSKKLEARNSDTIKAFYKFNAPIGLILAKGSYILQCTGDTLFKDRNCSVIKGEFVISDIIIPLEFNGTVKAKRIGNATYYFDKKNRCYAGTIINSFDSILTIAKTDKPNKTDYLEINTSFVYKIELDDIKKNVLFSIKPTKF